MNYLIVIFINVIHYLSVILDRNFLKFQTQYTDIDNNNDPFYFDVFLFFVCIISAQYWPGWYIDHKLLAIYNLL